MSTFASIPFISKYSNENLNMLQMSWESCSSQITTFQMFNFFILTALKKKTQKKPTSITSRL